VSSVVLNIKAIRKQKGVSQEYLAYLLGIDYSTYGKIERGAISLTVDRLEKIAAILEVTVEDIFKWKSEPSEKEGVEKELVEQKVHNEQLVQELERMKKEVELLKQQLSDKDKIIFLLENKLNKSGE
jgi:transcriptional regulator with XRE-family HTH domain